MSKPIMFCMLDSAQFLLVINQTNTLKIIIAWRYLPSKCIFKHESSITIIKFVQIKDL